MMDDQLRHRLQRIVQEYGASLADDPGRLRDLLAEGDSSRRREIFVLVSAARERIPAGLMSSTAVAGEGTIRSLARRLESECGLSDEVSWWAVNAWAVALGRLPEPLVRSGQETGHRAVVDPVEPPRRSSAPEAHGSSYRPALYWLVSSIACLVLMGVLADPGIDALGRQYYEMLMLSVAAVLSSKALLAAAETFRRSPRGAEWIRAYPAIARYERAWIWQIFVLETLGMAALFDGAYYWKSRDEYDVFMLVTAGVLAFLVFKVVRHFRQRSSLAD